jgi:hypothetical protein
MFIRVYNLGGFSDSVWTAIEVGKVPDKMETPYLAAPWLSGFYSIYLSWKWTDIAGEEPVVSMLLGGEMAAIADYYFKFKRLQVSNNIPKEKKLRKKGVKKSVIFCQQKVTLFLSKNEHLCFGRK